MLLATVFRWGRRCLPSLLFVLVLGAALSVRAQSQSSVSGMVKDQAGAAVSGATVSATNTASGNSYSTSADASGKYEFKGLPPGPYRVTARQTGFSDSGGNVNVGAGEAVTQDFALSVGSLEEEVTVTAAKGLRAASEIPQTVTVVTSADIEQRRPVGVAEAYERAPSISQTDPNPFRARPEVRGLQSSRVLVLVDGERLNNARFAADFVGVSPSLIDPTQIQTVEVVGGSSSSLYGSDAIGGTINITTRGPQRILEGARIGAKISGDYGSNSDFRRGGVILDYGIKQFAISTNFTRLINGNYHMGGEAINAADVVRFGVFANQAGALAGQPVINSFPVYNLPAGAEVGNSGARSNSYGADMMFFLNDKNSVRVRGQRSDFSDLGVPFTSTPTSTNRPETGISRLNKVNMRFESRDITSWFARFSVAYYYQRYRRSLDEERYQICAATNPPLAPNPLCSAAQTSIATTVVSFGPPPVTTTAFTGNPSRFLLLANAQTFNDNSGPGFDMQANFLPFKNAIYTTGLNYSKDKSRDTFSETRYSTAAATFGNVTSRIADARNTPNSDYINLGWYNQFEYTAMSRLRLAAGFRVDKWTTRALPTPNFPVGRLRALSLALLPAIQANPGGLNGGGFTGLDTLVNGSGTVETNNTVGTYNVSATVLLNGFNPYVRYSTSFREPDIISRYLTRDFSTSPIFSLPSLVNTALKPERGRDIEFGMKIDRQRFRGSVGYYRNRIKDATGTALGNYCIAPNPAAGILPIGAPAFGCAATQHFSQVFQTVNFSEVTLKGFEAVAEGDIGLGSMGSLSPYFTFNTLHGRNRTNDPTRLAIIRNLYNSSAPLELEGAVDDVPFYSLPNHQGAFAPRYTSRNGRVFAEYEYRWTSRITRVDPNEISFAGTTTYSNFASYEGVRKHSIRGGFRLGKENPVNITMGIENLTDNLYFLRFQPAPAVGRSFTIGTTINLGKKF
jgi:outer membrane receptor protein involved in Fe transport